MIPLKSFLFEEDGTTAVEYCVMLALLLLTLIVGLASTSGGVSDWWNNINTELNANGI